MCFKNTAGRKHTSVKWVKVEDVSISETLINQLFSINWFWKVEIGKTKSSDKNKQLIHQLPDNSMLSAGHPPCMNMASNGACRSSTSSASLPAASLWSFSYPSQLKGLNIQSCGPIPCLSQIRPFCSCFCSDLLKKVGLLLYVFIYCLPEKLNFTCLISSVILVCWGMQKNLPTWPAVVTDLESPERLQCL